MTLLKQDYSDCTVGTFLYSSQALEAAFLVPLPLAVEELFVFLPLLAFALAPADLLDAALLVLEAALLFPRVAGASLSDMERVWRSEVSTERFLEGFSSFLSDDPSCCRHRDNQLSPSFVNADTCVPSRPRRAGSFACPGLACLASLLKISMRLIST